MSGLLSSQQAHFFGPYFCNLKVLFRPIKQIDEISRFLLLGQKYGFQHCQSTAACADCRRKAFELCKMHTYSTAIYYCLLLVGLQEFSRVTTTISSHNDFIQVVFPNFVFFSFFAGPKMPRGCLIIKLICLFIYCITWRCHIVNGSQVCIV